MEKDGWLDQLLYAVLNFLNQTWLGITVAFVTAGVVTFLARRSPKSDWEYIKEGPDRLLTGAFVLLAGLKSTPRLVLPKGDFVCDSVPDPTTSIPMPQNCRWVTDGSFGVVYDYTFGDMVREFFTSLAYSTVAGLVGGGLGILLAISLPKDEALQADGV